MVRFTHPEMLYNFIVLFFLLAIYYIKHIRLNNRLKQKLGSKSVTSFLLNRLKVNSTLLRSYLIFLGIIFIIFASLGPQIGMKLAEVKRKGIDIMILFDTSKSMNARDVKPSRIEKAKYELGRLIDNLNGDRIGIIAFAGSAHLHCPLTEDYSAAKLFLGMIDTEIILDQGTDLAASIQLALDFIKEDKEKFKVVLLVSDGEDHQGDAIKLAETAEDLGVVIHTLGIGTRAGAPIPVLKEGSKEKFKRNNTGNIVTTSLNETVLQAVSNETGGKFIRVENQINAINPLIEELKKMEKKEIKSHYFSQYEDRYQIFLIIALIFFIIELLIATRTKRELIWEGRFRR